MELAEPIQLRFKKQSNQLRSKDSNIQTQFGFPKLPWNHISVTGIKLFQSPFSFMGVCIWNTKQNPIPHPGEKDISFPPTAISFLQDKNKPKLWEKPFEVGPFNLTEGGRKGEQTATAFNWWAFSQKAQAFTVLLNSHPSPSMQPWKYANTGQCSWDMVAQLQACHSHPGALTTTARSEERAAGSKQRGQMKEGMKGWKCQILTGPRQVENC